MFEQDLDQIQDFIVEHYSPAMCWGDFRPWLRWYRHHRLLGYMKNQDGIQGVGMVRFLHNKEQGLSDPYFNDPRANLCWVELVIAPKPEILVRLVDLLLTVWGPRERLAARRDHRGGAVKEYPFHVLARMSYKGLTQLQTSSKQLVST